MIKRTRLYRKRRIVENGKSKIISTVDEMTIWDRMKKYINSFPIGHTIFRLSIISEIYGSSKSYMKYNTVDSYIYQLKSVNVLKVGKPGRYKKLRDIPTHLTTSQLKKVSNKKSWESWFITIDYV